MIGMNRVLLIEDNRSMRQMLESILREKGYRVQGAKDTGTAELLLKKELFEVIISDYQLPDMDGLSFFNRIRSLEIPFILITAYGSIELAVKAMKQGVFDFIPKPVDPDYLFLLVEKALESTRIQRENIIFKEIYQNRNQPAIIGKSPAICEIARKVKNVAGTGTPVLLLGETGTGKELFARTIHNLSPRRNQPFIPINSASIPADLLENELFGHERGAYTDALARQRGKLELAQGGTFFMDEIGDLPLPLQGKILRVIEERKVSRIGSAQTIHLDIRFIFATNRELEREMRKGQFRKDLFYRINIFPVTIPPLRERKEDVGLLTEYFLKKFARDLNKPKCRLTRPARQKLLDYAWPGNVRELMNTIERAVINCRKDRIDPRDIILPEPAFPEVSEFGFSGTLPEVRSRALHQVERSKIRSVLRETGHNKKEAARILGISYKSLLKKIKDYRLS